MFCSSLKKTAAAALAVSIIYPLSFLEAQEDHFIGEDQTVKRVIQLQPQTGNKFVEETTETVSRVNREKLNELQEPVAKPKPSAAPEVGFEEIKVPKILKSQPMELTPQEPSKNSFQPLTPATQVIKSGDVLPPSETITELAPIPQQTAAPRVTQSSSLDVVPTTALPTENLPKTFTPATPASYSTKPVFSAPTRTSVVNKASLMTNQSESQIKTTIQSPKFVNVNKPVEISITLANTASQPSENIICEAIVPSHTKIIGVSPQPIDIDGQTLKFEMDRINGRAQQKIVLQLVPTSPRAIDVSTIVRTENKQRVSVGVRQPKLAVVVNGPRQANLGQKVVHEVIISNLGDGIASNVELNTLFPASLVNLKSTSLGTIKSIEPNQSIKVRYESQAIKAGPATIKTSAQSDDGMEAKLGSLDMQVFEPKLNISAIGPKINFVDRNGIYTIRLENPGQVDVTKVDIALAVPMGMKVTTISREANVDASKGILRWKFGKIAAGESEQIQMMAVVTEPGAQVCDITVGSEETSNKQISLQTMVTTRANVSVQIKNDSGPVQVGGRATFTVEVANRGSRKATDVNVRVELPESLKPVAMDGQQINIDGNSINFAEPEIMPGKKSVFRFAAIGQASGEHLVRSVTEVDGSERKTIAEDTVFVYEVDEARVSESLTPDVPRRN